MHVYLYAAPAAAAINRYLLQAPRSAANPPHAAAVIDRRDRQTHRQTDGRTLDRFMSLTAYYADRVTAARIMCTGT